jgi:biopolymer transport protein ExbB
MILRSVVLLACLACAGAEELSVAAARARAAAETSLATTRSSIVDARAAAIAHEGELRTLLASVQQRMNDSSRRRDEEREALRRAQRDSRSADDEMARQLELARTLAGVPAGTSAPDRIEAGLGERLDRLRQRLTVSRGDEAVIDRDGRVISAPLVRIGAAAAVALGVDDRSRGMLRLVGSTPAVAGPPIPAAREVAGYQLVPLDVTGTLTRMTTGDRGWSEWMRAGGFFMWPILLVGICGLVVALERCWWLARSGADRPGSPALRLREVARAAPDGARSTRENALEQALIAEQARLDRGLDLIGVLAAVAPLLGLLGTVTGMIGMFSALSQAGDQSRALSGNISVALVTTQFGLIIAVPLLIAHALIARVIDKRRGALEALATALSECEAVA